MQRHPHYSFEITAMHGTDDNGASCFTADAVVRDAAGNEVARVPGHHMHAYVEAAEDEAIEAARRAIRELRADGNSPIP